MLPLLLPDTHKFSSLCYHFYCISALFAHIHPKQKIRRTNESSLHSAEFEEVTTRFELVNEGFADLCLTTWPRHHMSRNCFLLFFWSGRRGSNSLPPPWQGGALPDELRPHIGEFLLSRSLRATHFIIYYVSRKVKRFLRTFFKVFYAFSSAGFSSMAGQFLSSSFRSTL